MAGPTTGDARSHSGERHGDGCHDDGNRDCRRAIGRFARMVYDNLDWLRDNGHPKWKSVTIDHEALLIPNASENQQLL